jgi:hypothetical protein
MARYKQIDTSALLLPVDLETPILPGTMKGKGSVAHFLC